MGTASGSLAQAPAGGQHTKRGADATACLVHNDGVDVPITGERQRKLLRAVVTPFLRCVLERRRGCDAILDRNAANTLGGVRFKSETRL